MEINSTIHKKSLSDEIAELIKEQIKQGKLKQGEKLPTETELMKLFGVGRSSIREAVKMLVNSGYLSVQQGRGTYVKSNEDESFRQRLKRADIQELREVRDILEEPIARLAIKRRTDSDLKAINRYLIERKNAAEKCDVLQCIQADINFHNSIAQATHNSILSELYRSMTVHFSSGYEYIYQEDTSRLLETQAIHEELYHAIKDKDADTAARATRLLWKDIKTDNDE